MKIIHLFMLLSGLFLAGCAMNAPSTLEIPTLDCAIIQKNIEQNCNVKLDIKLEPYPPQESPNNCRFITKDMKHEYYFSVIPKNYRGGFSSINDIKNALKPRDYEEIAIEQGAVYVNKSFAIDQRTQQDLRLYFFDEKNLYVVQASSRFGPQDDEQCISKEGVLRLVNLRAVNGTFTVNNS